MEGDLVLGSELLISWVSSSFSHYVDIGSEECSKMVIRHRDNTQDLSHEASGWHLKGGERRVGRPGVGLALCECYTVWRWKEQTLLSACLGLDPGSPHSLCSFGKFSQALCPPFLFYAMCAMVVCGSEDWAAGRTCRAILWMLEIVVRLIGVMLITVQCYPEEMTFGPFWIALL